MQNLPILDKIDYLVIGHLTKDLLNSGSRIGGTAAYSALTAKALGMRVGIVTSWAADLSLGTLKDIPIINYPTDESTTFENIYTPQGRIQYLHNVAPQLNYHIIPEIWRTTPIVHLGPVAQEVETGMVRRFTDSLIGITPQGWMRSWDSKKLVHPSEWPESAYVLNQAGAAVISIDDVENDEERIEEMATQCRILAVTESHQGSRLYWNGDIRRFRPPDVEEIDATGAGDIYASAFFSRLFTTRDPWEAARFATHLSAYSVTRSGLEASIPSQTEIQDCMVEVL